MKIMTSLCSVLIHRTICQHRRTMFIKFYDITKIGTTTSTTRTFTNFYSTTNNYPQSTYKILNRFLSTINPKNGNNSQKSSSRPPPSPSPTPPPKPPPQSPELENDLLQKLRIRSTLYYVAAAGILFIGMTYAAVPLYRMFCQAYSYGGTTNVGHDSDKVENMEKIKDRIIKIRFNADIGASMRWNFRPQQYEIKVVPGETALAFYTAKNPTDQPVIGISTYNVIPFEAGAYFNKIQCFCFEEQQLNPHEEVDMPVFFYIDPEIVADPKLEFLDTITLSYTFFESKEGAEIPLPPSYAKSH